MGRSDLGRKAPPVLREGLNNCCVLDNSISDT